MSDSKLQLRSLEGSGPSKSILFGTVIVLLLVANVYLLSRVNRVQITMSHIESTLQDQITSQQEMSSVYAGKTRRDIDALREEMDKVRSETTGHTKKAVRNESARLQKRVSQQQRQQHEELVGELGHVRTTAHETQFEVEAVRDDLADVRTGVSQAQSELEFTAEALEETSGEVGRLRHGVAHNRSAISALRKLGERDRLRFHLRKSKDFLRLGEIRLRLKKTDSKRNKYSLEVMADDRKVIKKDRHVNEPVEFYVSGSSQPYEIVVTGVKKEEVMGYLSKPAMQMARK